MFKLQTCLLVLLGATLLFSSVERKLTKTAWRNTPVEVGEAKLKRGAAEFDKVFTESDDDWLEGLTISVRNTSNKTIVFIEFSLTLFDKDEGPLPGRIPFSFPFFYASSEVSNRSDGSRPVQPGESVKVTLSSEEFDKLKTHLLNSDYPISYRNADVRLDKVLFADGELWYKGQLFYRDPNNPQRYKRRPKSNSLTQRRVLEDAKPVTLLRADVGRDGAVQVLVPLRVLIDKLV